MVTSAAVRGRVDTLPLPAFLASPAIFSISTVLPAPVPLRTTAGLVAPPTLRDLAGALTTRSDASRLCGAGSLVDFTPGMVTSPIATQQHPLGTPQGTAGQGRPGTGARPISRMKVRPWRMLQRQQRNGTERCKTAKCANQDGEPGRAKTAREMPAARAKNSRVNQLSPRCMVLATCDPCLYAAVAILSAQPSASDDSPG